MTDFAGRKPPGAEIARFGYRYSTGEQKSANFFAQLELTSPSSPDLTYTVYVFDGSEAGELLASQVRPGDRSQSLSFELTVNPDKNQTLCVYATSATGDVVHERIPPEGCINPDEDRPQDYYWFP